jgi:hypothetical protein
MNFSTTTLKQQAIDKVSQYYSYVFFDKWAWDPAASKWQPNAYWVPFVDIDTAGSGIDLPAKVNLTCSSTTTTDLFPYLVGDIEVDQPGEQKYNFTMVRAQNSTLGRLEHVNTEVSVFHPVYNPSTTITTYELPIEYYEENPDILVSTDLTTYADDIHTYYHEQVITYRCRFKARADLELYQLVAVSGFDSSTYGEFEDGDYRIIEIAYRLDNGAQTNEVEVVLMLSSLFRSYQNLKRPFVNTVLEIQKIVKAEQAKANQTILGYPYAASAGTTTLGKSWFLVNYSVASSYRSRREAYRLDAGSWSTTMPWLLTKGSDGIYYAKKASLDTT